MRCTSTPPKRNRGHERDETQLASNGSIPTKVASKPHVTVRVWCVQRCAIKGSNRSSRQHLFWKLFGFYSVLRVGRDVFRVEDHFLITTAEVSRATSTLMQSATSTSDCQTRTPSQSSQACMGNCERRCTDLWMSAQRWREHDAQVLEAGGFSRGVASPCHSFQEALQTYILVHGDDFLIVGRREVRKHVLSLLRAAYELSKVVTLGWELSQSRTFSFLGRTLTLRQRRIEYEADQQHVSRALKALG